jgi:hypothetical protein
MRTLVATRSAAMIFGSGRMVTLVPGIPAHPGIRDLFD